MDSSRKQPVGPERADVGSLSLAETSAPAAFSMGLGRGRNSLGHQTPWSPQGEGVPWGRGHGRSLFRAAPQPQCLHVVDTQAAGVTEDTHHGPLPGLVGLEVRWWAEVQGHFGSPVSLLSVLFAQTMHRGEGFEWPLSL